MDELTTNGVERPAQNWTKFPNCILDNLSEFTGNELKITALMIRKNLGFQEKANNKFAAKYVAAKLGMSEKTAWECLTNLESRGVIRCIGKQWHGLKLYEVAWRKPNGVIRKKSRSVKITEQNSPVNSTVLAQKKLRTVLENHKVKENQASSSAENMLIHPTFANVKSGSKKDKKVLDLSSIEPVLEILRREDKNAEKAISYNLKRMIENALEKDGADFVCDAVRGRIMQAKERQKPLALSKFFDPESAEWRTECAKRVAVKAPIDTASTLPVFGAGEKWYA